MMVEQMLHPAGTPDNPRQYTMAAALLPDPLRTQARNLLATIGNTPLIRLEKVGREFPGVVICAKAEYANPGGSVKDRAGLNMILDGERAGRLRAEHTILDATSGNTGIAYANDRRGAGLPGETLPSRQCLDRAQAHPESLRRGDGV